jgi:flagellar L-ring protein precursor FlgH
MKSLGQLFVSGGAIAALLSGCAGAPSSIVQGPLTARQRPAIAPLPANGSIYQAAAYRPLFEDRKARMVGDILTISIAEKTSANKAGANSASKAGSASVAAPQILGMPTMTSAKLGLNVTTATKSDEKAAESASNSFTGVIGVTVIDVLPNGYLVVSGEKQIAFDKSGEYVRFSGTINPDMIQTGNSIASTQVADARVEYRTNSRLDATEINSMLARFFLSLSPL